LVALSSQSNPGAIFTPAVVLLPYAMATLTTILLSHLSQHLCPIPAPFPESGAEDSSLIPHPSSLRPSVAALFVALHLSAMIVCLLLTTWWELYRGHPLLDPAWIALAPADARGSLNSIPPLAWLTVSGLLLWWRGSQLAREEVDFPSLLTRFLLGTGGLVTLATFGATAPLGMPAGPLLMATYLLFGLMSLALARLEATGRGRIAALDRQWGWQSAILAMLLLVCGFAFGLLVMPPLAELAQWAWEHLLFPLLGLILEALRWIVHLLGLDQPPEPGAMPSGDGFSPPPGERDNPFVLPGWLREAARMVFNVCWLAVILWGLYSWVRRWRWDRRASASSGPIRTRMPWSPRLLLRALRAWLLQTILALWPALRRWLPKNGDPLETDRTIRLLYRRLLSWGADHGSPRERWSTPLEYKKTLSDRWPDLSDSVGTLTESYLRVRYGDMELDEEELEAARTDWRRIAHHTDSPSPRVKRYPSS